MSEHESRFKNALNKIVNDIEISKSPRKEKAQFFKSLEWDLAGLREKLEDDDYALKVYNALCNNLWVHHQSKEVFHCSWRAAGSIVAANRRVHGDYLDYYCSGEEGTVDEEIKKDFKEIGWSLKIDELDMAKAIQSDLEESAELLSQVNQKQESSDEA